MSIDAKEAKFTLPIFPRGNHCYSFMTVLAINRFALVMRWYLFQYCYWVFFQSRAKRAMIASADFEHFGVNNWAAVGPNMILKKGAVEKV